MNHAAARPRPASRRARAASAAALALAIIAAGAAPAGAACPDSGSPDRTVCDYWSALFIPGVNALAYLPRDDTRWLGAGLTLNLYIWGDNDPRSGASQGRYLFEVGVLRAQNRDDAGTMMRARAGLTRSFEGNASRTWLIPFYGLQLGALRASSTGLRGFVAGTLGIHALYTPQLIINLESDYMVPFRNQRRLAGPSVQLTASVAWW
ncbi:MAG: hypothetical protein Tsb0020_26600 [Haliangiales bacterium]